MSHGGVEAATLTWRSEGELRWLEGRLGAAKVVFTTRRGGISRVPFDSLNLGPTGEDDPANVERNRAAALAAAGCRAGSAAFARQVHGTTVQVAGWPVGSLDKEADAQVTTSLGVTPLVVVADCYPVALATAGAVGVVHCGWRGTAAGVLEKTIAALAAQTGRGPGEFKAAVGPGIGPCCYRVGSEVPRRFGIDVEGETSFDLGGQIVERLLGAGIDPDRLVCAGLCTSCNPELFFSYRRDGAETGRQAGFAWLG